MKKRVTYIVIILISVVSNPVEAQNRLLRFRHFTVEQGLSENRITAALQDSKGTLWAGNKISVNRYEGEKTSTYYLKRNNNINLLLEDSENTIWAATEKGLFVFDAKKDEFTAIKPTQETESYFFEHNILSMIEAKDGSYWFSTISGYLVNFELEEDSGLLLSSLKVYEQPKQKGFNITKIIEGRKNMFWLTNTHGQVLQWENGMINETAFQQAGNNQSINDASMDSDGTLWLGTNGNGLFSFEPNKGNIRHFLNSKGEGSVNNNIILAVYTEGENVWIGTDGGGLNLYQQDEETFNYFLQNYSTNYSISDNSILSIEKGLNNTIVLGTVHGGISLFRNDLSVKNIPAKMLGFSHKDQQGSTVLEDSNHNIWLSAGREGLRKYNLQTGHLTVFKDENSKPEDLSGRIVLSLFEDRNQRIWIGTLRGGLNIYGLQEERFLPLEGRADFRNIYALEEDGLGNIWMGHRHGITVFNQKLEVKREISIASKENAASKSVTVIFKDVKGDMWVGTTDGLYRYENTSTGYVEHQSEGAPALSGKYILSIGETADLSILVGTYGFGINKFDRSSGTFELPKFNEQIKGRIIRGILRDSADNIWISTDAGLSKISPDQKVQNFGINEGIQPFNGGAANLGSSGEILMAGNYGLSYFQPKDLVPETSDIKVHFTSVTAVNENSGQSSFQIEAENEGERPAIHLNPGNVLLNVNFAGSDLIAPEEIRYAYFMEGLNKSWQIIGNQNYLSFSDISPGEYTLKVRALSTPKGNNGDEATLDITVAASFWEMTSVRLGFIAFFGLLLVGLYRWRISAIKQQEEKLKQLLEAKKIEVKNQERKVSENEIALLKMEKENQLLSQRKLKTELNFRTEELTNNTLRTVHKNKLLNDIKEKLKLELGQRNINKKNIKDIISHIDDSFMLDKEWENFYALFNQIHPTFMAGLKKEYPQLSERDNRFCALIKLNFSSQHIATLLGISLSSVKVARHRLRKKLELKKEETFQDFFDSLGDPNVMHLTPTDSNFV